MIANAGIVDMKNGFGVGLFHSVDGDYEGFWPIFRDPLSAEKGLL
jgi:hypothetical protein